MGSSVLRAALLLVALGAFGCRTGGATQGRDDAPAATAPVGSPGERHGAAVTTTAPGTSDRAAVALNPEGLQPGPAAEDPPDVDPGPVESATAALVNDLASARPKDAARAATSLARLGTPAAARALATRALPGDPLEAVAVAGLGWAGGPAHADRLLAALRSPSADARRAAAFSVGAAATIDWDRPLALALTAADPPGRAAALDAVGLAGRTTLLPDVARATRDGDADVRAAALRALAGIPLPGARVLLAERAAAEGVADVEPLTPGPSTDEAPPAGCPPLPDGPEALASLLADTHAALVPRAMAALALGRSGHTAPLETVGPTWPRLVRAAALIARQQAGEPVPPELVALERRALEVGRLAHPALLGPLDACVLFAVQGGARP